MASGSQYSASNKTGSFSSGNHKGRLCTTGTEIQAATKVGGGQESYAIDTSAGLYKGTDLILDPTGTVYQTKMASLTWFGKFGYYIPVGSTSSFSALYSGATQVGTAGIAALDTTEGLPATYTTAASGGSQGGVNRALFYTIRKFNPSFKLRWKIDEAAANIRFYAGFTGATAVIGNSDDPLNALAGFGIAINTIQANYQIYHNDTVGATDLDDTGIAKDTAYHDIELWADDNGSQFWWSLDGSTPVAVTAEIPAQTTPLSCQFLATAVNADAKVLTVTKSIITSDK